MAYHIFDYGPAGRHILVDDEGRLVVNGDAAASGHIYAYGDTGFPLLVDGAGRLLINASGLTLAEQLDFQDSVKSQGETYPPSGAANGDRYIIGAGASGAWTGWDDSITELENSIWVEYQPNEGWMTWVEDENILYVYGDSGWVPYSSGAGSNAYLKNQHLIPDAPAAYNVGSPTDRFDTIFAQSGNFSSGIQVGEGTVHINGQDIVGPEYGIYFDKGTRNIVIGDGVSSPLQEDNVVIGVGALSAIASGRWNTAIGDDAALSATNVDGIVAIGTSAGSSITTGAWSVCIGVNAGDSITNEESNVCIGVNADIVGGTWGAVAIGSNAIASGSNQIRIGATGAEVHCERMFIQKRLEMPIVRLGENAGTEIAGSGAYSTTIGSFSLANATTGDNNTAIGYNALTSLLVGDGNSAFGVNAGYSLKNGNNNVLLGNSAGYVLNGGSSNILIGVYVGDSITTGSNNVCMGLSAGTSITTGSNITCLGHQSDVSDGSVGSQTAIGTNAIASGTNTMRLGTNNTEVHCENLYVQQQMLHRGCYGELYEDNDAGTLIDITTAGTFYPMVSGFFGQETGSPYVDVVAESGQIRIGANGNGLYQIHCSLSYGGTVDILSEAAIHINGNIQHNMHIKRKLSAAGDIGAVTLAGMARLSTNDFVDIRFTSDSNGDDINLNHANLTIHRIAR
jgi:hypothetical protein